jgi:phosphatidylglycerol:prolipoprotein diacylglycerol transferase
MFPRIPLPGLPFALPTYGLMVALGFLAALRLAERLSRRAGFAPNAVQDLAVWACLGGLAGAKIALLIIDRPKSVADALHVVFEGGVFYGGFAGAALVTVFLCRRRRVSVHALGDVLAAPIAIGHAFGRVGCFLAGCCYGVTCDAPWAVHFSNPLSVPVQSGIPSAFGLHPVQLYEAAANLLLGALALWLFARRRFAGQVIWSYVAAYGVMRFVVEFWRGDARGHVGPLSTSQAGGLIATTIGLALLARCARRRESPIVAPADPPAEPPPVPAEAPGPALP